MNNKGHIVKGSHTKSRQLSSLEHERTTYDQLLAYKKAAKGLQDHSKSMRILKNDVQNKSMSSNNQNRDFITDQPVFFAQM